MASLMRISLLRQTASLASPASRFSAARFGPTTLQNTARVAAFHASSKRSLLPPGPQVVHGTVNDAEPVPAMDASHGSYHWTFERLVAAGLVPLTLAPFAAGSLNPTMDAVLCATFLVHTHMGLSTVLVDYVPTWGYPKLRKSLTWVLNIATGLVGVGLYEFETNDVGVTELISKLWKA